MCEAVTTQVTVPAKYLATVGAVEGFDVGVREEVCLQVATLVERSSTGGTLVGRLLHVERLVNGERPCLAESFPTFTAFEWFLLRMDVPEWDGNKTTIGGEKLVICEHHLRFAPGMP